MKSSLIFALYGDLEDARAIRHTFGSDPLVGVNGFAARDVADLERFAIAEQFEREYFILFALNAILRHGAHATRADVGPDQLRVKD